MRYGEIMRRGQATVVAFLTMLLAVPALPGDFELKLIGTFTTGVFDESAAETVAHDPSTQRLFVTNADARGVDVLDITDPTDPILLFTIDLSSVGDEPTAVAFHGGSGAVAVKSDPVTDPGFVVLFDSDGNFLGPPIMVGSLPDALTFTPDGAKVLVANEGEPNDEYTVDPEGSVSIIDVSTGMVKTASFNKFNDDKEALLAAGVRIFGPASSTTPAGETSATVAQDLEPENVTVSADSGTAWVTLQENNALAVLDLESCEFTKVIALGFKNHLLLAHGLDASNRDDAINIATWPVNGMYQPDSIAAYQFEGLTFLVTANEGDARDFDGFSEEERAGKLTLGGVLAAIPDLQDNANLGRLKITTSPPEGKEEAAGPDGEDVFNKLFSYGARSFSIWTADGEQVFDSGDQFEQITAALLEEDFNSNDDEHPSGDSRSDDKGPEPEAVVVGEVGGHTFAFVGLERVGGIMVYEISNPFRPCFVQYVNNRDFGVEFDIGACEDCEDDCVDECAGDEDVDECVAECIDDCVKENCPMAGVGGRDPGDLAAEGLLFISAEESPDAVGPLLVVANEVSGSTSIFEIQLDEGAQDVCAELEDD